MPDTSAITGSRSLPAADLARRHDPSEVPFETTADAPPGAGLVGQERAIRALEYAIGVMHGDCNVFVIGPPGFGKRTLVRSALATRAPARPSPSDWVYVNNFASPQQPLAIELPPGRGAGLKSDMEHLLAELRSAIPAIFESEEYSQRVEKIDAELNARREEAVKGIQEDAERQSITLLRTPAGYAFVPVKDGQMLGTDEYQALPEEERDRITLAITALQERLEKVIRDAMRGRKERSERMRALNREMVTLAAGQIVEDLVKRYEAFPRVVGYLRALERDTLDNAELFLRSSEAQASPGLGSDGALRRYAVNVVVDRAASSAGAEVVLCDHPTYANLLGRIEHVHHLGTLVTDFTLIKPGALHGANGGYLVVDALKILTQPFSWEALKRALWRREIRIESVGELWGVASTVSLEPQPIPLSVRVVLLGERRLYYLLQALDPDFGRLFKVVADFDEDFERTPGACAQFATMIATLAAKDDLLPFGRAAVARAMDEAARQAGDSRKLSADRAALTRLLREADFLAREAGATTVALRHVDAAVDAQHARSNRLPLRLREAIQRGVILIDTQGEKVGQVNGLALFEVGDCPFAAPTRITATTRVGDGQVVDIQREAHLGGAIHSKGVMILSQFLAARYSANRPLSLAASLVFEQTYGEVEGDSASLAELCALLSSLANVALRQGLAVTGSVNQLGEVQAVGGVNEKIEGFFDICQERGLSGGQGVIIPAANVGHLMLRDRVVEAVSAGRFQVYAVATVDEALEILTGVPAGGLALTGEAPQQSVNGRVAQRLRDFARLRSAPLVKASSPQRWKNRVPRNRA